MRTTAYRYPNEQIILAGTLFLVLLVIALTASATVCASAIFILAFVVFSFQVGLSHHRQLLASAQPVTSEQLPELAEMVNLTKNRLQPGPIDVYLLPSRELNAYTFGLSAPKVVVLYSALARAMDAEEMTFILGHEMGHVALGHTWLNTLVGGIAGIPSSFTAAAVLSVAFLGWNRACEYSADRAGLLACGSAEKAVSALVKLGAGPKANSIRELELAYRNLDAEDDTFIGSLNEALATHPMLIRRIQRIREFSSSATYTRLKVQITKNA